MRLRTQVTGGLLLLLLVTTGLASYQLFLTRELNEANHQLAAADLELSRSSLRIRRHCGRLLDLTRRYVVLRDPRYVDELRRIREEVDREIAYLESLPLVDTGPIQVLRHQWLQYVSQGEALEAAVGRGGDVDELLREVLQALGEPDELARRLDQAATERAAEVIQTSGERAATAFRVTFVVAASGLVLTVALALWIGHSTAAPLRALTRGTEAMAAGDFAHRVDVKGPTELALLARDFNSLARELGELDRMKRDFVASVSHDLKAPLASIRETTALLLEMDSGLTAKARRLLELTEQSAQRLQTMIGDLLDIARLEAGALTLQLETLDLNQCCEQAIEQAAVLAEGSQIQLERRVTTEALPVRADPALLLQALGNLLANAIQYSPRGGTIVVETTAVFRSDGTRAARAGVTDNGPGVPEKDKGRIFDRFYRSQAGASRPAGTGLGLAIARSIVEHHGGRIWVENGKHGGSVFCVELPSGLTTTGAAGADTT